MGNALDIYDGHRDEQIENGSFSESFFIDPSGANTEIKGIFDEPYTTGNKDQGQVQQQMLKPRILISTIPSGIIPRTTEILVRSETMKIQKVDRDPNGIPRLWLV